MAGKFSHNGFTLAEVLITLGIIGVVAAITLPTLIQNYQKQVYVNSLQKALNTTENMFKKMQADEEAADLGSTEFFTKGVCHSTTSNWSTECSDGYGDVEVYDRIIPKYLKVVKIGKVADSKIKYKRNYLNPYGKPEYLKTNEIDEVNGAGRGKLRIFYTTDGMIFYITPYYDCSYNSVSSRYDIWQGLIRFSVDVNGEKGPNEVGRDLFEFSFDANGKLDTKARSNTWSGYNPEFTERIIKNGWKMDY